MAETRPYYITTAISYPNDAPHIGHAYEAVATDALARFRRLQGRDVFFLTGTDEHGVKMLQTARKQGITPAELADRNTPRFRDMVAALDCSNDDFISTREERHKRASRRDLAAHAGQWRHLSVDLCRLVLGAGRSLLRRERAEGGRRRAEALAAGNAGRVGGGGELFLPALGLSGQAARAITSAHPDFIGPETRANEVKSFVRGGLQDLSVSRTTFDWGIPVPGDPKHIMYVWVDALTNYLTGVGFPDVQSPMFKRYWPADVHIIGKDIVRFHAVYWPAFLMSAGVALPKRVFGHGFLYNRGEKMSKSVGNVVDPFVLVGDYGVDPLALFPVARGAVRPGRQLQPRRHRAAHQRRSRQRPRQSRPALAVDDRQELRGHDARAG